jgi:hypothetical protein
MPKRLKYLAKVQNLHDGRGGTETAQAFCVLLRPVHAAALFLSILLLAQHVVAQSTLIPLTTRRDIVFDHAGQHLYITTSDGFVQSYNLVSGTFDASYNLGGSLNGLDIAPDDSFLLAAQDNLQGSQIVVHRLNLVTGAVVNIGFAPAGEAADGAWDVAIASNGLGMVTSAWGGPDLPTSIKSIFLPTAFQ